MVLLTQFSRKLNLMFRLLVPPSIAGILVIKIGIFIPMRAQVSEVAILTQLSRKLNLTFRMLVPPSIAGILVIKIGIFIPIPTLMIVFSLLFLFPSGLLVTLLV